jgi:hypothetical protein
MSAWVLVCNPKKFDLLGMWQAEESPGDWTIGRYRNEIQVRDPLAIWLSGSTGGIAAIGEVNGLPYRTEEPTDATYWFDAPTHEHWVVPITVTRWFVPAVARETVKADVELAGTTLVRQPFSPNPHSLSDEQWRRLMDLVSKAEQGNSASPWDLEPGQRIRRTDLHSRYGGSGQGDICPSAKTPNILIFTDPGSGHQHGYYDEWADDGTFHYTGMGQTGNQTFTSGNKAIRDHLVPRVTRRSHLRR